MLIIHPFVVVNNQLEHLLTLSVSQSVSMSHSVENSTPSEASAAVDEQGSSVSVEVVVGRNDNGEYDNRSTLSTFDDEMFVSDHHQELATDEEEDEDDDDDDVDDDTPTTNQVEFEYTILNAKVLLGIECLILLLLLQVTKQQQKFLMP